MGLFSFVKDAGAKLFGKKEEPTLKADALLAHVKSLGLPYQRLKITLQDDDVVVEGEVKKQEDAEKILLAVGNVEGVDKVESQMTVIEPETPPAKYHTVVSGDSLSKISKEFYGDPMKYNIIFDANKPMLTHPDKIYPGQVLRIPTL